MLQGEGRCSPGLWEREREELSVRKSSREPRVLPHEWWGPWEKVHSYNHAEGTVTCAWERASVGTPVSYPAGPPGLPLPASAREAGSAQPGSSAPIEPPQSVASLSTIVQTPETDQASWGQGCGVHSEASHLLDTGMGNCPPLRGRGWGWGGPGQGVVEKREGLWARAKLEGEIRMTKGWRVILTHKTGRGCRER